MFGQEVGKAVAVLGPIVALLILGTWLALRSGLSTVRSERGGLFRMWTNFTGVLFRFVLYIAGLAVVQEWIGARVMLGY